MKNTFLFLCFAMALLSFVALPSNHNHKAAARPDPEETFQQFCSGCHGERAATFVDRKWVHGDSRSEIINSITNGWVNNGMPAFKDGLSEEQIAALADYIRENIEHQSEYQFTAAPVSNIFTSEGITVRLDTVVTGLLSPWGFAQLPDGNYLISDREGVLYRVDHQQRKTPITNTPTVLAMGQGGLMDIVLHPDYARNGWVYMSYSKFKVENGDTLTTTAIVRGKIKGNQFTQAQEIFEALPYTKTRHHFGSKLVFDKQGYLFFSVGERGRHDDFPQKTDNDNGKVHRIKDDGSIPPDNPFAAQAGPGRSIYSFGHRNPQGLALQPGTNTLWEHEHGPRGGDEINIIRKAANYGWPVITYGINYNGKPMSAITQQEGMEQPVMYWTPSIAPCGMTFITGNRYPQWKGNLFSGSLRFKYVNRSVINEQLVASEEKLFPNIGRVRNLAMGTDGYLYVAVEKPGMVFRVVPVQP